MTQETITEIKTSNDLGNAQVGDYFPANRGAGNTGTVNYAPKLNQDPSPGLAANLTLNGFSIGTTTSTEIGYVHGVTSNIQTQFNNLTSTYPGSTSIVTVGTITTGTWNASIIGVPYGGTGVASTTAYGLVTGGTTSTGALQNAGTGTSGQFYQSAGSAALGIWTTSSGSGNVAMTTSPIFTTPALGTPSAGVLSSCTGYPMSGLTGLGTGVATALGINIGSAGAPVTFNGALGTPSSGTLTSATGLPISTGVSGLATGVATFLATPTSANLIAAMTDETGTGANVFATSPTLVTPILGTPTSGTLTSCTGLPVSTGISGMGTGVATFLATPSSANLLAALTDETGSGSAVFATSPTLVTPILGTPTSGTLTNCTGLPVAGGGSGRASTTAYAVICGGTTSTGAEQSTATGSSGQLLQSAGSAALPAYTTATYPATTTANRVLFSSATNTVSEITTTASRTLIANSSGVPTFSNTIYADIVNPPTSGAINLGDLTGGVSFSCLSSGGNTVNYLSTYGSVSGGGVVNLSAAGSADANVAVSIVGKGNLGVNAGGRTNATTGATGCIGELLQSAFASSVAMTSATVTQVQSLSLTAGDWDVWAIFVSTPAATTTQTLVTAGLNLTTATLPTPTTAATASRVTEAGSIAANTPVHLQTGMYPVSVSATTSIYLNAAVTYATSTLTGGGLIFARRRS